MMVEIHVFYTLLYPQCLPQYLVPSRYSDYLLNEQQADI